jgi:hypothetical protein
MSQKYVNEQMARRHISQNFEDVTTKNKTGTSLNLSETGTDQKDPMSSISKIPEEISMNIKYTNTPHESEQVEFNVYDFTKRKDTQNNDFNNTKDTAEFGDAEMQFSRGSQDVCL